MSYRVAIIENNIIATNTIRRRLSEEIMASGHEVFILTCGTDENMKLARNAGFTVVDIGQSTRNPFEILNYIFNLYKTLKNLNIDVCLTFTIRPAIWGNIITRLLGIPTVTNITGIGPLFSRNDIAYRGARLLYKFVLKKTFRIFFQNHDDLNIFLEKKYASPSRVERIPGSGVDYDFYFPRPKNLGNNDFKFLFISRLVKDKGIIEFIEAAKVLKSKLQNVSFDVLGPLWEQNLKDNTITKKDLESWTEAGIINYLGESKDIRNFIANADCVVLPSYREGMSNVLLEASSMERPCVTTDTTGCRDIVTDGVTGFLCKVQNSEDLALKLEKMYHLSDEVRLKMGKNARIKVIKEFDKKIVVSAYMKAISDIKNSLQTQ